MEFGADPLSESDVGSIEETEFVVRRIGGCMSLEDQNNLRAFIKEFSNRLLSHLEVVLRKINDSVSACTGILHMYMYACMYSRDPQKVMEFNTLSLHVHVHLSLNNFMYSTCTCIAYKLRMQIVTSAYRISAYRPPLNGIGLF